MPNRVTEYLNKELAAKRSGLSVRRLLELAQRGSLRKKIVRNPETNQRMAVFCTEDLDRIKTGDTRKVGDAAMRHILSQPTNAGIDALVRGAGQLFEAKQHSRPWMTAEEAADRTGLPASFLVGLIIAGKLPALDVGVRPGGRYRIAWRDLDAISGERITSSPPLRRLEGHTRSNAQSAIVPDL
jgi:excisionase family DNA binding protein